MGGEIIYSRQKRSKFLMENFSEEIPPIIKIYSLAGSASSSSASPESSSSSQSLPPPPHTLLATAAHSSPNQSSEQRQGSSPASNNMAYQGYSPAQPHHPGIPGMKRPYPGGGGGPPMYYEPQSSSLYQILPNFNSNSCSE